MQDKPLGRYSTAKLHRIQSWLAIATITGIALIMTCLILPGWLWAAGGLRTRTAVAWGITDAVVALLFWILLRIIGEVNKDIDEVLKARDDEFKRRYGS